MSNGTTDRTRKRSPHQPAAAFQLVLTSVDGSRRSHDLPEKGEMIIGRDRSATWVIEDASISRQHAKVVGGSPPYIEDLGSTNGTRVQGRELAPGTRAPLTLGTVVEIGDVVGLICVGGLAEEVEIAPQSVRGERPAHERDAIVKSPAMLEAYNLVDLIAPSRLPVLILGETGVGKDVYAEVVHRASDRADKPFLRLNCAALPENLLEAELFGYERGAFTGAVQAKPGLFESADGGTVFLDEIGEMPPVTQAKLLRVLESGEVMRIGSLKPKKIDVRFVAATHRNLEALSDGGQFRTDLYYRINGVSVTIPPLRRRKEEVAALAEHFAARSARRAIGVSDAALEVLVRHRWPGNVRELRNVIERAVLLSRGKPIEAEHIQLHGKSYSDEEQENLAARPTLMPTIDDTDMGLDKPQNLRDEFSSIERMRILQMLEKCAGNQSRAAKLLGISRSTLIRRLRDYGHGSTRKH
jgi:transcriptional regulator with PAS, ATPase and Fis domain